MGLQGASIVLEVAFPAVLTPQGSWVIARGLDQGLAPGETTCKHIQPASAGLRRNILFCAPCKKNVKASSWQLCSRMVPLHLREPGRAGYAFP